MNKETLCNQSFSLLYCHVPECIIGDIMHNILSYNQLAGWKQSVERLNHTIDRTIDEADQLNDYYDCLIECDDDQATCKRICRSILSPL